MRLPVWAGMCTSGMIGLELPLEAGEGLLGALLLTPITYWDVSPPLRAEHFSVEMHQGIFAAISSIAEKGRSFSITLLTSRLPEDFGEEGVTGIILSGLMHRAEG